MRCMTCGAELPDGTAFCTSCGAKQIPQTPVQPVQPIPPVQQSYDPNQMYQNPAWSNAGNNMGGQPYPGNNMMNHPTGDTTPISAWGYIGYNILFSIPLVGLVMLFVYSFGSNTNVNLKNYARSFLLTMLIVFILTIVITVIFGAAFVALFDQISNYSGSYSY